MNGRHLCLQLPAILVARVRIRENMVRLAVHFAVIIVAIMHHVMLPAAVADLFARPTSVRSQLASDLVNPAGPTSSTSQSAVLRLRGERCICSLAVRDPARQGHSDAGGPQGERPPTRGAILRHPSVSVVGVAHVGSACSIHALVVTRGYDPRLCLHGRCRAWGRAAARSWAHVLRLLF